MDIKQRIVDKLLSGRFILTIAVALIMVYSCLKDITYIDKLNEIFLVVIYAYFNRGDRTPTNGGTSEKTVNGG